MVTRFIPIWNVWDRDGTESQKSNC